MGNRRVRSFLPIGIFVLWAFLALGLWLGVQFVKLLAPPRRTRRGL